MTVLLAGVGQHFFSKHKQMDERSRDAACRLSCWRLSQQLTTASAHACETIMFPGSADKFDLLVGDVSGTTIADGCTHDSASATKFCRGVWASTETQQRAGSSVGVHETITSPADANTVHLLVGNAFGVAITCECTHDGADATKCNPRLVRVPVGKHSVATLLGLQVRCGRDTLFLVHYMSRNSNKTHACQQKRTHLANVRARRGQEMQRRHQHHNIAIQRMASPQSTTLFFVKVSGLVLLISLQAKKEAWFFILAEPKTGLATKNQNKFNLKPGAQNSWPSATTFFPKCLSVFNPVHLKIMFSIQEILMHFASGEPCLFPGSPPWATLKPDQGQLCVWEQRILSYWKRQFKISSWQQAFCRAWIS